MLRHWFHNWCCIYIFHKKSRFTTTWRQRHTNTNWFFLVKILIPLGFCFVSSILRMYVYFRKGRFDLFAFTLVCSHFYDTNHWYNPYSNPLGLVKRFSIVMMTSLVYVFLIIKLTDRQLSWTSTLISFTSFPGLKHSILLSYPVKF